MKKCIIFIILSALFIITFWWIAVPESLIENLIINSLGNREIYLEAEGFSKGFFISFRAKKLILKKKASKNNSDISLLIFDDMHGRISLASLLKLSPELVFDCTMNNGEITGTLKLTGKHRFSLYGKNIRTNGLPFLEMLGAKGDGDLSCELFLDDGAGKLQFILKDANLKSSNIVLPLEKFSDIRGIVKIAGDVLHVKYLTLSGKSIKAAAEGYIINGNADLEFKISVYPSSEADLPYSQLPLEYMNRKYYYVIPVKTNLFSLFSKN